jgi:hypothetical protein
MTSVALELAARPQHLGQLGMVGELAQPRRRPRRQAAAAPAGEAADDAVGYIHWPPLKRSAGQGVHSVCAGCWPTSVTVLLATMLFSAVTSRGGSELLSLLSK